MKTWNVRLRTAVAIAACVSFVPAVGAGTTVVNVGFGEVFTGSIDEAGVDTVEARFFASVGASVKITVESLRGSTLLPEVVVTLEGDPGSPLGQSQRIAWLPFGNAIHRFTAPETGMYVAEVGGISGSGGFLARLSGTGVEVPMVTVSGTVSDALTDSPIQGAVVTVNDSPFATTDESGAYSGELAPGSYTATFEAEGFGTESRILEVSAGSPATLDVDLTPLVPVTLEAGVSGDTSPGGELTATVAIEAPPGTTIQSITWSQESGLGASIVGADTETASVTLAPLADYKDELIRVLSEPPVEAGDLPPNVPLPPGEFHGGLQDRLQVVGVNPFALEETALVKLMVEVDTDLGTFTDEVEIHTSLPWKVSTGLRNVPQGAPVLLHAPDQATFAWTLTDTPPGSTATLQDSGTRNPYFTPDFPGLYELELSDGVTAAVSTLQVYAGTWRGVIVDQDIDGRPVSDTACTFCHNGELAADKFTEWEDSGHAEIFTDNLDTSTHYSSRCFSCHTVGYDLEVDNAGVDESDGYQAFLDAGLLSNPGDNWTTVLEDFPETARLANIQCENCHGPQDSNAHGFAGPLGEPRVDLSSDVCASCHGEPARHARFQQWQLSGHANYDLAVREGDSGNCSRCHTGNGFLAWLPVLLDDDPATDPTASIEVGWTLDEVHPQTCATCHDPHAEGTTSGSDPNATVRISGDTPPLIAGFQATEVGRGAICMTCHNSRRGLRNDDTFDTFPTSEKARAPHGSAQADVLFGENAFLVDTGERGGHSFVEDACVTCHMETTPPPDILSYNQGGTNHTFFADRNICADCHSPHLTADDVQSGVRHLMDQVKDLIEDRMVELIDELTSAGNTLDLNGEATITDASEVSAMEFGEFRGRQSITVTFTAGGTVGPFRVNDVDVLNDVPVIIGTLYDFADDALIKAGWNWNLFNNDGSLGVHNPFFANGALIAARDALVAMPAGASASATAPERRILRQRDRYRLDRERRGR